MKISIHALREEGDTGTAEKPAPYEDFYPRPPRGGRRLFYVKKRGKMLFLSTPSARRATFGLLPRCPFLLFLSTPSARRATPAQPQTTRKPKRFLSTPSARRATAARDRLRPAFRISIHALREEGDIGQSSMSAPSVDFYPRPPRGGRQAYTVEEAKAIIISIHALREEGDKKSMHRATQQTKFLSTPSARRATCWRLNLCQQYHISIHALREEGDSLPSLHQFLRLSISIHALREEGDQEWADKMGIAKKFLSTPSARRATVQTQTAARLGNAFLSTPSARRAT